jgi:hypothetical protein|tara:strand:+ start:24002 stop:25321 length:1320 start_codon:yes stop_codon:yes gene_type:complete
MTQDLTKLPLITNPYLRDSNSGSLIKEFLFNHWKNKKFVFYKVMLLYQQLPKKPDIFQYIPTKVLNSIRIKNNVFLIYDCSNEGYSSLETPWNFFYIIQYNCKKYNIPINKVIYATSNLREKENLQKYINSGNINMSLRNDMKIFYFHAFKWSIGNRLKGELIANVFPLQSEYNHIYTHGENESHVKVKIKSNRYWKVMKENFQQSYIHNKIILSLSRRSREHRVLANYVLKMNKDTNNYCTVSQGLLQKTLNGHNIQSIQDYLKKELPIFGMRYDRKWLKMLPIIADTSDFATNHAHNLNVKLCQQHLIELVLETDVDNKNNTMMFFSEKTFRPIGLLMPFIIYGHQHCYKYLQNLGFILYTDIFDYSFDSEPDNTKRFYLIFCQLKKLIDTLKNMSHQEQINWRLSHKSALIHNFEKLFEYKDELQDFQSLIAYTRQ